MERLWRTYKYEHLYLKESPSLKDLKRYKTDQNTIPTDLRVGGHLNTT